MFEEIRALFAVKDNQGFSETEVQAACQKYGILPELLKQYYLQLGKVIPLNRQQNYLCEPENLIDAGDYLIFYKENQYVAQWALRKSDLHLENPPVYCAFDAKNFQPECETLYDFLCAMAGFQAASWGLPYCSEDLYYYEEEHLTQIAKHYRKKPYELHVWIDILFYGNEEDEVICLLGGDQLLYASSNQAHFQKLENFMEQMNLEVF